MGSPNWAALAKRGVFPDGVHPVDKVLDASDELSAIEGVGKATVAKLIKAEVRSKADIAKLTDEELVEIVGIPMKGKLRKVVAAKPPEKKED